MTTITREQVQKIIDAADEVITALAGTNADVHPDNSTKMTQLYDDLNDHYAPPEVVRELARIALASLEAEPIGAFYIADQQVGGTSDYIKDGEWPIDNGVIEVYAAPPASEREQILRKNEPVAYLVCNGHLYQDRPFLDLSTARKSVKDRNDGAEIKALCVCEISAEK
ncbi:hypothetical protein QUR37_21245 [Salmonella enterica]|nr:hypothetical protein [Salmonella enterica]MDJ6375954.1 hypothetical protein [Salmonella enterica]